LLLGQEKFVIRACRVSTMLPQHDAGLFTQMFLQSRKISATIL